MLNINSLKVSNFELDTLAIEWSLSNPLNEDLTSYSLELLRSESPIGPFEFVYRPSLNTNSYLDNCVNTGSKSRNYYYMFRVIYKPDDSTFIDTTAITVMPPPDVIAIDVIRAERLLLKRYIKTKVWFYMARSIGVKCKNCWDAKLQRRTKHDCPICYGTGYDAGFFDPIPGYIELNPHPKTLQASGFGPMQPSQTSGWTTSYPLLKTNDWIFEVDSGRRWRINQIGYNEKSRFVTKQLLGLEEDIKSHIIYDIRLPSVWVEPWK
jgi:hypothetical protein